MKNDFGTIVIASALTICVVISDPLHMDAQTEKPLPWPNGILVYHALPDLLGVQV